jgi:hypothetical protein
MNQLYQDDNRCQWNPGDEIMFREGGTGHPITAIVRCVDIPLRRLKVVTTFYGWEGWVNMEHCFKIEVE